MIKLLNIYDQQAAYKLHNITYDLTQLASE